MLTMDQAHPSQSSAPHLMEADTEEVRMKTDFFKKLGYSSAEVKAALKKLGLGTDTNSVLGELVRSRATTGSCALSSADSDERSLSWKVTLLPPCGMTGPSKTMPQLEEKKATDDLRPVVIDGSNVAMSHGNKEVFSCRGIQLAVNFFLDRGHNTVTVFVPSWRKEQARPDAPITDQHILIELEKQKLVVFTPSRHIGGKRVVCYDDRFIVKLAYDADGVIVSNDTYRDLQGEKPEWKKFIEERLLMYSFVNDKFMPPDDPLGRHGPSLDNFLRRNPLPAEQKRLLCPYDKKCTYGIKCKFYHPERTNQSYLSVADELREKAQMSSHKEERKLKPRALQGEPGAVHNPSSYPLEPNADLQSSLHSNQVSENRLLFMDDPPRTSHNQIQLSSPGAQSHKEWAGLHRLPSHYYASSSHECLDSGLGSYESQYSECSHCLSPSHRPRPQQQSALAGSRHTSVHMEKNNPIQPSSCCSYAVPSAAHPQPPRNPHMDCKSHPKYDSRPPNMFPHSTPHQHSLPTHPQYNTGPHHQPNYWSDPFQLLPQARTSHSLPGHISNSGCSYNGHQYQPWGQQPSSPSPDSKKLELRKRLQAIFNPHEVETVMDMFPHLTDAEKLAAEILNLKLQKGIF